MQPIYCFSGLGADETLFANIRLTGYTLHPIRWLAPVQGETLPQYAQRLSQQITTPRPVLLGVSFGGMLATEAAKLVNAKQTLLISSIQSARHFPAYYRWLGQLNSINHVPSTWLTTPNPLANYLFGVETKADKKLLRYYMQTADPHYLKWALQAIINWDNKVVPKKLLHIHGTKDRIIPLPPGVQYKVTGGGHLMVYNRAPVINDLLQNILTGLD